MAVVGLFSGLFSGQVWAGERLQAARREVTDSEPSGPRSPRDDSAGIESDSVELELDEDGESPRFLLYPYAGNRRGYIVRAPETGPGTDGTKPLGFHIQAEGAYLYEDVWRGAAEVRAAQSRLYMQGNYDLMLEGPTPRVEGDVQVDGPVRDRLHFISFEVGGQLSPSPVVAIRLAPILTVMFEDRRSELEEPLVVPWMGWGASVDVFPIRPLVLRGRAAIHGSFGATMVQLRATAGVALGRAELYAGYDQRWLGAVGLGGPTAGVAVRF